MHSENLLVCHIRQGGNRLQSIIYAGVPIIFEQLCLGQVLNVGKHGARSLAAILQAAMAANVEGHAAVHEDIVPADRAGQGRGQDVPKSLA